MIRNYVYNSYISETNKSLFEIFFVKLVLAGAFAKTWCAKPPALRAQR